ncbi:MAG: tetratricopeptide repeat protein [Pyrinomonadaceae bacterium]
MNISQFFKFCFRPAIRVCFVVPFLLVDVSAQNRSTISGYVFASGRAPVAQVAVELRNDVNSVIGRTKTDGSGRFVFTGVPSGRFAVTVIPLGTNFEGQSQDVEISGIGARGQLIPDNPQLDFYLKLRRGSESSGGSEVIFAQEVPEAAERIYKVAIADLDSQRTEQGIADLKKAIEIFPNYFLALERLGAEQLKQESYDEAAKSFSKAVSVYQRSFVSWYGLTYASFVLQKWQAAVDAAEKALEREKNSVNTLILLGISQRSLKKYDDAERSLLRAKKIDEGKTPDLYWNLALLYAHNLKKYQAAADALELYLKANPAIPDGTSVRRLIKQFRENHLSSK